MCAKRGSTIYRVKASERDISYGPAKWRLTLSLFPSHVCFSLLLFPPLRERETQAMKETRGRDSTKEGKRGVEGGGKSLGRSSCIKCVYRLRPWKKRRSPKGALKRSGKKITLCTPYVIRARPVFDEHACPPPPAFFFFFLDDGSHVRHVQQTLHTHCDIASLAFGYFVSVLRTRARLGRSVNSSLKKSICALNDAAMKVYFAIFKY